MIKNQTGEWSGAKLILWIACLLPCLWLVRDLIFGEPLEEGHIVLLGLMLFTGLFNRISGRGQIRIKIGKDGAELETSDVASEREVHMNSN